MPKETEKKMKFQQKIWKRVLPAAIVLVLTGCQSLPLPLKDLFVSTTTPTLTQSTTGTSNTAETSGTSQALSAGTGEKTTRELVLEKYRAARLKTTSDKMVQLWSVESEYPLKTGENIVESNYGPDAKRTTAKGSTKESYDGKETGSAWFLTDREFILKQSGETKSYPRKDIRDQNNYQIDRLIELILTQYTVNLDSGTYFVTVTTQTEPTIRELMEYLGYRKTGKDAYKGSLYLEALLEEATGNLRAVNYVYRNSLDGFTDNGQITFSDWNIPVNTDPLAQTQPDSTVPGASQPITTPSSSGSSTGSAATKGVSTSSPASASTNP